MKAFTKLLIMCGLSLLVPANVFATEQNIDHNSETITVVYSGDIQGHLLPTNV